MAITKIQSESLNLADDFAFTGTITGAGGNNRPAFIASHGAGGFNGYTVTVGLFNNEILDTDNAYDTSTYKFTPQVEGYYHTTVRIGFDADAGYGGHQIFIMKNGSPIYRSEFYLTSNYHNNANTSGQVSQIVYMNGTTDYLQGGYAVTTTGATYGSSQYGVFQSYKIIT